MKTAALWIRFCATTAEPEWKWPHGRKAYFRGATWTWCSDFNHWENLAQYIYIVKSHPSTGLQYTQVRSSCLPCGWREGAMLYAVCSYCLGLCTWHIGLHITSQQWGLTRKGVGWGVPVDEGRLFGLIGKRISLFKPICSLWSPRTRVRTSFGVQRFRPLLQR